MLEIQGEVVGPEAFRQWPEELQERIKSDIAELEKELQKILHTMPQWESEQRRELRALNQEVASRAVSHLIEELVRQYDDLPEVLGYIDQVREDLLENAERFQTPEPRSPQEAMAQAMRGGPREESFGRYRVNVIVDNADREGAPVVYEDLPTHANVIGRIEQVAQFGALTTDFNLVKPGALHTANGGFLLIDVRKLFMQPIIWEELKRALFSGEIRIQGLTDALGFATTRTLQPQPIPLDVKIVLLGDPMVYYLLSRADPDFAELFKVAADFDDRVPRDGGNTARYGQLIADIARRENLRPVHKRAIARVIERAARLADDAERLTGSHGVLIPASNVKHLMLRRDVVDAARQGRFHVYPVETVDEGIELLTGVAAGESDEEGRFPPDTVNGRVAATLLQFAERARAFTGGGDAAGGRRP